MQAVILAGGLGERLRPMTEQTAKVMAPINSKPFLSHLLDHLKNRGIDDIVLCIGYLGKQVRDFFGDGESLGVKIKYSEEKEELLGTGGALMQAQDLLDEHFFVINGDTYLLIDYSEVERAFFNHGKKALMVVYDNQEDTGVKNNIELDSDLMVKRYNKESPDPDLKYVEAGVLVLRREALNFVEEGCSVSLEKGLYPPLIQQRELVAYVTKQRFYDIGTPERKRTFEKFLRGRAK